MKPCIKLVGAGMVQPLIAFQGIKSVKRVGIAFSPNQILTDFNTYTVPILNLNLQTPPSILTALNTSLKPSNLKHISYHDLNNRNPDFFPAFFASMLFANKNHGDYEIWKSLSNTQKQNLFFLKARGHEAVSVYYTTKYSVLSDVSYKKALHTFQEAVSPPSIYKAH